MGEGDFTRYRRRLRQLHRQLQPRTYLEIGVDKGASLALADRETLAIGIDPHPSVEADLDPNTRVFECSSDSFFADYDVAGLFGGAGIDLALVDGLHLFEQALRDVANVGRFLSPGGHVVVHDTLPYDSVVAQRQRVTQRWTGDVWKAVECLRRERPELSLVTVDVPPTGLTLIWGLHPADTTLLDDYRRLVDTYLCLPYEAFERVRQQWRVLPDGEHVVSDLLEAAYVS